MSLLNKILGPESKYDKSLPYTYEARVPIVEGGETYNSYFSDTICGLLEYLGENRIGPDGVKIFEIYQTQELLIDHSMCITPDNAWLSKPDICRAFKQHYKGHIQEGSCSFKDRDREGCGP